MAKTETTKQLEQAIFRATSKIGVYGCFEVTIGIGGNERVDYMTMDAKGVFRCYEIKASLADFRSKAKLSFCGIFNYYVLTDELYEKVKGSIAPGIGVYVGGRLVKKAKRQEPRHPIETLVYSMMRSLARDAAKLYQSEQPAYTDMMNQRIKRLEREAEEARANYRQLQADVSDRYGRRWWRGDTP